VLPGVGVGVVVPLVVVSSEESVDVEVFSAALVGEASIVVVALYR
jgi:hypothetical protein